MTELKVLDHGFVRLRNVSGPTRRTEHYVTVQYAPGTNFNFKLNRLVDKPFDADDTDPAQSARMSFDQFDSTRTREQDLKLAKYLLHNHHTTPFEMIQVWIEMKLPIFVARQFVRHRTVSINEVSGRYVKLPAEWYIPDPATIGVKPDNIKQGRILELGLNPAAVEFCNTLNSLCHNSYSTYELALAAGVPTEVARLCLHLNHYTHWLWSQDLHNVLHFLKLRLDSHAQWEAQQYARAVARLLSQALPELMSLFVQEYGLNLE